VNAPLRLALIAAIGGLLISGCSFDRRTSAFRCDQGEPCGDGRVCQAGWCVEVGGPGSDADVPGGDGGPDAAFVCPAACSRCDLDTCVMNCDADGSCPDLVVCPVGVKCKVECGGASSCAAGVDCSDAASCVIECSNNLACAGPISCGDFRCRVECDGADSCGGGIDCTDACQCDVLCGGTGSCVMPAMCPFAGQCAPSPECTSIQGNCNEC
jgi:hypothetical protein